VGRADQIVRIIHSAKKIVKWTKKLCYFCYRWQP